MAEVGIVASIIGIAGAGAKLSLELYEFGATVSTARHETNSIARSVSHYSRTLKVLGKRLQDERPIHSQDALVLVGEIRDHSVSVLGQIRSMIPRRARDNSLSFKKRLRWTFRKTKVEFLLGRLDAEKATLTLLVQILYTGNIIRTAKENDDSSEETVAEINAECAQAQALILERQAAAEPLPDLQTAAQSEEDEFLLTMSDEQVEAGELIASSANSLVLHREQSLAELDNAFNDYSAAESQAIAIRQSGDWLHYLLRAWTNLSYTSGGTSDETTSWKTALSRTSSPNVAESGEASELPSTSGATRSSARYSTSGREKLNLYADSSAAKNKNAAMNHAKHATLAASGRGNTSKSHRSPTGATKLHNGASYTKLQLLGAAGKAVPDALPQAGSGKPGGTDSRQSTTRPQRATADSASDDEVYYERRKSEKSAPRTRYHYHDRRLSGKARSKLEKDEEEYFRRDDLTDAQTSKSKHAEPADAVDFLFVKCQGKTHALSFPQRAIARGTVSTQDLYDHVRRALIVPDGYPPLLFHKGTYIDPNTPVSVNELKIHQHSMIDCQFGKSWAHWPKLTNAGRSRKID